METRKELVYKSTAQVLTELRKELIAPTKRKDHKELHTLFNIIKGWQNFYNGKLSYCSKKTLAFYSIYRHLSLQNEQYIRLGMLFGLHFHAFNNSYVTASLPVIVLTLSPKEEVDEINYQPPCPE